MGNYIQKFTGLFLAAFLFTISSVIAQAPLGFNYQGVALTNAGTPIASKVISLRIALIESQQLGTVRYQEVHNVNTDAYGQFSVIIGNGQASTGKMTDVQWSKFPYYMKVELDLTGGTAYVFVGTSQLLSVPYALYANNAGAASISVDSVKSELATIKLSQKGDSIVLNNNRGGVYIPKIDSLSKIVTQILGIKAGTIKYVKDSASKIPVAIGIGYDALKNFDSVAVNSANIAIGQSAGALLPKYSDANYNNDNVFIGNASGWGIGSSTGRGANQNIMLGNYTGQYMNGTAANNIIIGHEAGRFSYGTLGSLTPVFNQNVAIGSRSMQYAIAAESNVAIGSENFNRSKKVNRNVSIGNNMAPDYNGDDNIIIGSQMLTDTSSNGSKNVIIGAAVATNLRGSGNVILGYKAAGDSIFLNTSNKLIIANDKTKTPLIYGEFDNKKVTINGDLTVTGNLNGSSVGVSTNFMDTLANIKIGDNNKLDYVTIGNDPNISNIAGRENTALGQLSLSSNTTGYRNTALGSQSSRAGTTASLNTSVGYYTLRSNITGSNNTAIGYETMASNTTGVQNTVVGLKALWKNISGSNNNAVGSYALTNSLTASELNAFGTFSLSNNTTGIQNSAFGHATLQNNTTGDNNTAIGYNSLNANTTGHANTALGSFGLNLNTSGYENTAVGDSAMLSNTTGFQNTAIGLMSLRENTTGSNNTAVGIHSLLANTRGVYNGGFGSYSLYFNTTGSNNTAVGSLALYKNTTGSNNVSLGMQSLTNSTTSSFNTAIGTYSQFGTITGTANSSLGAYSLFSNTTGSNNTALGYYSMSLNTTGYENSAIGAFSLYSNTTGIYNTAIGNKSLTANTTGKDNTALGLLALASNTTGNSNTGIGNGSLQSNTTGYQSIAIGQGALYSNTTANKNNAIGFESLNKNTTGAENVALGHSSLYTNTTGSQNVAIGNSALKSNTTGSNNTAVGTSALTSNTTGSSNIVFGETSLRYNTIGSDNVSIGRGTLANNIANSQNTAIGSYAMYNANSDAAGVNAANTALGFSALKGSNTPANNTGIYNTAIGSGSLINLTAGSRNTVVGQNAGVTITTGSNNVLLGQDADISTNSLSNAIAIGAGAIVSASNTIQLGNTSITDVKTSGIISSTKGFLPPKFTSVQRDGISSPQLGLIIFCYNCSVKGQMQYFDGTDWVDMVGNTAISGLNIGTSFQGGKIAYILQSGDPGYDPNRLHGLISSTVDQTISSTSSYFTGTGVMWQIGTYGGGTTVFDITNANGIVIGTGKSNTDLIIAKQTSTGRPFAAAALAVAHNGGGYTDWFLPSKDELYKLYLNRVAIGGFEANWYWSSSEKNDAYADALNFGTGNFDGIGGYKGPGGTPYKVRAIRTF